MKFGERLLSAGFIDQAQLEAALSHQKRTGLRIGEALYELGYISEETLLTQLARLFKTRFVSAAKLARARVEPELIKIVPMKLAEEYLAFPIVRSKDGASLGVVTAEPQNNKLTEELAIVTGISRIEVYVTTRDAALALIERHYRGNLRAFDLLQQRTLDRQAGIAVAVEVEQEPQVKPSSRVVEPAELSGTQRPRTSSWTRAIERLHKDSQLSDNDFIESLSVLVGLVELYAQERQGHSSRVARLVKAVSEELGLEEKDVNYNLIAVYLHELGKRASEHLTLPSIKASEKHRLLAQRYQQTPQRLFENVRLPMEVNRILSRLYEAYDGSGLPEGLSADRIPLGARIIAVVDAYDDFTQNTGNLVGGVLNPQEALDRLRKESGRLFDPQVLSALEKALSKVTAASGRVVLLAEPENLSDTQLQIKLASAGLEVRLARDSDQALQILNSENLVALIADLSLEPLDGLELLKRARAKSPSLPVYLMGVNPSPHTVTEAFKRGVTDFLTRPFLPEVLLAKIEKELSSGREQSLSRPTLSSSSVKGGSEIVIEVEGEAERRTPAEDSLPLVSSVTISSSGGTAGKILSGTLEGKRALSLIHALAAKRQSGQLSLRLGKQKGEIFFNEGHICQATVGENSGEEAFLELAAWQDCLYKFDPTVVPPQRSIKTSTAKLIEIAKLMS